MMHPLAWLLPALVLPLGLAACKGGGSGARCGDTCQRLYDEGECNIQRPGATEEELLDRCETECKGAMKEQGDVGDYDPFEPSPASVSVELENRDQAELWMECIEEKSCADIEDGYCAPVW